MLLKNHIKPIETKIRKRNVVFIAGIGGMGISCIGLLSVIFHLNGVDSLGTSWTIFAVCMVILAGIFATVTHYGGKPLNALADQKHALIGEYHAKLSWQEHVITSLAIENGETTTYTVGYTAEDNQNNTTTSFSRFSKCQVLFDVVAPSSPYIRFKSDGDEMFAIELHLHKIS